MPSSFFAELKKYVGLNSTDAQLLSEMRPLLKSHLTAIVDRFYERILAHPGAASVIEGKEQVKRLKKTLRLWIRSILDGPYDEEYWASHSRIGRRHVEVGLPQFYMFGAMNLIREDIQTVLFEKYGNQPEELQPRLRALNKVLDIDLAVIVETFHEDVMQRLHEEQDRQNREKLESIQTMVSSLAHEIRNPLNSANLHVTLLERKLNKAGASDAAGKQIRVIREEIKRLEQLLSDFIAFARPPRINPGQADLNELLQNVVYQLKERAEESGVAISLALESELLPAVFDWDRMQQVFYNLVVNAIEAQQDGGRVRIESGAQDGAISVEIRDWGPGLPPNKDVFEPFFTTKSSGTGLGLSVVRSIIHMHGGKITADSSDEGACFRIELSSPPKSST